MTIQLIKEVVAPQITDFAAPSGKNAYSFRFNVATGNLSIVRNTGGSEVKLPDSHIINLEDYAETVWSDKLLSFSWSTANPGHLNCEIVCAPSSIWARSAFSFEAIILPPSHTNTTM